MVNRGKWVDASKLDDMKPSDILNEENAFCYFIAVEFLEGYISINADKYKGKF